MPRNESKNKIRLENFPLYFPLYFHLYVKIGCFSSYLNFDELIFFGYFKSQISKWAHMSEPLSVTRGLKDSYSLSNKQTINVRSHGSHCS